MKIKPLSILLYLKKDPKLSKIMRITVFLLFICVFQLMATNSSAQDAKITVETEQISIKQLIDEIETQTNYFVVYSRTEVNLGQTVKVNKLSGTVKEMLNDAFANTSLGFLFDNDYIILKKRNETLTSPLSVQEIKQDDSREVKGIIRDEMNESVIGASVVIKGTTRGTITDTNGEFSIKVKEGDVLFISYIGYVSQEIKTEKKNFLDIILHEDLKTLNEVVVVGFGVQKKINLTGAIGTADAKTFEQRPVTNAVQALQGAVPGLTITNTSSGGELNAAKSIRIRGTGTIGSGSSGDPLVLIDGMESSLTSINPQDIETVSVLKDAAASSIYGSRAPFGVILVTTKSGKQGKPVINYNNSFRFNTQVMLPEMQNSWEFVNYFNDAEYNGSNNWLYDSNYLNLVKNYFDGKSDAGIAMYEGSGGKWNGDFSYGNVNWLKEYYKKWTPSQEHNLSVSGGNEKYTYYLSANIMDQDGSMRYGTENYTRYNVTGKISAKVLDYLKVDYTSRFSRTDYNRPTMMDSDFYNHVLRRGRPVRPIYDPNGYYASDVNYIQVMTDAGRHAEQNDGLRQQFKFTFTPLKDWNIIAEMNMSFTNDWSHEDRKLIYSHYADNPEKTYRAVLSPTTSYVNELARRNTFLNPNIYTNYHRSFGLHNLAGTLGMQHENSKNRMLTAQRNDLMSYDLPVLDLTTGTVTAGSNIGEWATTGFFGRVNYDYEGRYLLELNGRYDGSSRFRRDKRWVLSPSFSLGWNLAREKFWEGLSNYVQILKFRFSYGELANQSTTNLYPTYVTMETGTSAGRWLINNVKPNISKAPELVSASLTWEKVKTQNIGVDWGALNNRLTGSLDYYVRKTIGMVGAGVELPAILGTTVPNTNNRDLATYGWELELGWRDVIKDFSYGVRVNVSDARTKVTRFPNPTGTLGDITRGFAGNIENEWIGDIYGFETVGIAKSDAEMQAHLESLPNGGQNALGSKWAAGDIMYADLDGDGKISTGEGTIHNMGDLTKLGNNTPRFLTGINLDASWKGFSLSMFWQGVLKRDFAPTAMVFWGANSGGQWWSTAFKPHLDYFRADADHALGQNLDSYYPRPIFNSNKNNHIQSKYIQNAAYMRLKNLQIGYTLPTKMTRTIGLSKVNFFVSGENLLTLTNLTKTMDPETAGVGVHGGSIYPLSKTYSFGLNVNF